MVAAYTLLLVGFSNELVSNFSVGQYWGCFSWLFGIFRFFSWPVGNFSWLTRKFQAFNWPGGDFSWPAMKLLDFSWSPYFQVFSWPAGSFSWLLEFIKSFLVGFWHTCFRISKNGSGLHPSFSCFSNDLVSNFSVGQQVVLVGFWYFFRFFSCLLGFYPNFSVGQQVVSVGFWDVFS